MRFQGFITVLTWAACSALCLSVVAYLGASHPAGSPWLLAVAVGAALGAACGAATIWLRGSQAGGTLLMGVLFGVLLAVGYAVWRG
jgi:hypothetical protein